MKRALRFLGVIAILSAQVSLAQLPPITTGYVSVELQSVATGLSSPVDLVSAKDGSDRLFIVEQPGRIKVLKNGAINPTPFLDLTAQTIWGGEEGLVGLAFHPGFSDPTSPGYRRLYTYGTERVNGTADFTVPMSGSPAHQCVLTEWQVSAGNPDVVDPSSKRVVLRVDHPQSNHNGGKLLFRATDGYLYFSIGDGGNGNDVGNGHTAGIGNAQDKTNLLGKIMRIDPLPPAENPTSADPISANAKYRVPASNPFVGGAGLDEIFAYGLRNPYRFCFDLPTDRLVAGDVGQNNIEEIDIIERGKNYGWNRKEGTFLFNPGNGSISADPNPDPAYTDPVLEYDHNNGVAVVGGFVHRGAALTALTGTYVFGDYVSAGDSARIFQGDLTAGSIKELAIGINPHPIGLRLQGFGIDDAGEMYVMLDSGDQNAGQISKIVPIPATPALLNLSTRARVEADDGGIAIAGFIVTGSVPKTLVLRALGPSLTVNGQPLPGRLTNPTLTLVDANGATLDVNDDWMAHPRKQELINFNLAPADPHEAAMVETLQPGAYTAMMRGVTGETGIGLIELYDPDTSESANAVNLSTRGRVQIGDNVMIAGMIIGGNTTQRVMIRAIGPSLTSHGVAGVLQDPTLELIDSSGATIASNDNWRSSQEAEITASGLAPTDDNESAIIRTLTPGNYTAIVRGAGSTSGVGLVEIYRLTP